MKKQLTQEEAAQKYFTQIKRLNDWAQYAGKAAAVSLTDKQRKDRATKASHSTKRYKKAHEPQSNIILPN